MPVLLLQGDSDVIALPNGSRKLMNKLASTDRSLRIFPGADHWLYQSIIPTVSFKYRLDPKLGVAGEVKEWLSRR